MVGVQQPSLNKLLKDLERQGLITVHHTAVVVQNPEGLQRVVRDAR